MMGAVRRAPVFRGKDAWSVGGEPVVAGTYEIPMLRECRRSYCAFAALQMFEAGWMHGFSRADLMSRISGRWGRWPGSDISLAPGGTALIFKIIAFT